MAFEDFYHKKRVLVTGAGGFIGSHLVEELVKLGSEVRAFVHYNSGNNWGLLETVDQEITQGLEVVAGDIQDAFFVRKAVSGMDIVFHLCSLISIPYSYVAPQNVVRVNVEGALNVMEACLKEGVKRVVHTSTSEVYGSAQYVPIDEHHPLVPQSPYAASKLGADKIAESYFLSFGLPVVILRPFNTFGPRQSARAIIPTIITQLITNPEIRLGLLDSIRDLTFVKDTVKGFLLAGMVEAIEGQTINIGMGVGHSGKEIVKTIFELSGYSKPVVSDSQRIRPEKSEVMKLIANPSKAKELLKWQPDYSFQQGLSSVLQWIERNISRYKPNVYNI